MLLRYKIKSLRKLEIQLSQHRILTFGLWRSGANEF